LQVGQTGTTNLLMQTTDNDAQVSNLYSVWQDTAWGSSSLPVLVTVSGAPAAGVAACIVRFVAAALS
jgi:hypothetical protein